MDEKRLSFKEIVAVASMLFGLFFGAGNVIFPVSLGQLAGNQLWFAILGFILTAVGLPLLAVIAMGISRSESVQSMTAKVSKGYSIFFTLALYLTIGPFFATPRVATVSFEVGLAPFTSATNASLWLWVYSFIFFAVALFFALRPQKILDLVGKVLNPLFLILLMTMILRAFLTDTVNVGNSLSSEAYALNAFSTGFLEGYNTMDCLAALAFGIIILRSIRGLGVNEPSRVAVEMVKSGWLSLGFMGAIYLCLSLLGVLSLNFTEVSVNGGVAMAHIAHHYFGTQGLILLAMVMAMACLKTGIGLIVALSETFTDLFPQFLTQSQWAWVATIVSFLSANMGLNNIISYAIPVLMLLYPLAMTLILLHLMEPWISSRSIYISVTFFTFIAALFDFVNNLPPILSQQAWAQRMIQWASDYLPFYEIGFGWVIPALGGLIIGGLWHYWMRDTYQSHPAHG